MRYTKIGLFLLQHFNLTIHSRLLYANEKLCYLQNQVMIKINDVGIQSKLLIQNIILYFKF